MDKFIKYAGNKDCPKCFGKGYYRYDDKHSKPCELCCKHEGGFWELTENYGDAGDLCCLDGCGFTKKKE